MIQEQLRSLYLYLIMGGVILAGAGKVLLIGGGILRLGGYRNISFRLCIGKLNLIGEKILGKQPGSQHLLRVCLVEYTDRRPLGNHLRMLRIKLRNRQYRCLKIHQFIFTDVRERGIGSHPGGSGGRIYGKDTLSSIEKVGRIAGNFEGGKCSGFPMFRDGIQQRFGGIVKEKDFSILGGITAVQLLQHLDHHVIGGFIDERNQYILPVDQEVTVLPLRHCRLRHLPDKIPGQGIRQCIAQRLHIGLIDITSFCGTHKGNGIMNAINGAFFQKFRYNLLLGHPIKTQLAATQAICLIGKQIIQRRHNIGAGQIGGYMIWIGDANIGGGTGRDIGNHIVIDVSIVCVQPNVYRDIGVQGLKSVYGLLINFCLGFVGIVLCPKGDAKWFCLVKGIRQRKRL